MIMAHGVTDYGLSWASLAGKLKGDYDIIMYDARGHGFSEKVSGLYDIGTHVEDLLGLIEAVNIEKPILVGHSMGSGIISSLAAEYPNLPAAVIMEDPALFEMVEVLKGVDISDWKRMVEVDKVRSKQELMKIARTKRHPGWSDFEYDHWAEAKLLVDPNVVNVLKGIELRGPAKEFPRIIAPTLILKADAKPEDRKKHIEITSLLPKGKIVHIDGATHLVRQDKPKETEKQIRAFLADLD
jgi:pimeloyl-ACP methyl ester carboxylesterase